MTAMTATDFLAELWRRRYLALAVLVAAVAVGVFVAGRGYTVYRASTDVLLDTPRSQAVDVGTKGQQNDTVPEIDTLATRARLLGNLMASAPIENAIARRVELDPDRLIVVPPPDTEIDESLPAAQSREDADKAGATALIVSSDSTLPIIHVVGQAPDPDTANLLVAGAAREVERYLSSVASKDEVPDIQRLEVDSIGLHGAVAQRGGPGAVAAVLAALAVLAIGWGALVVVSRALADWRRIEPGPGPVAVNGHAVRPAAGAGPVRSEHDRRPRRKPKLARNGLPRSPETARPR
ncbi:MAG: hypothetical protein R2700_15835 [Solirubrobacterales bacterium]